MRVSTKMVEAAFGVRKIDRIIIREMLEAALRADAITIKARSGKEAQHAYNDVFPGEDCDMGFSTLSEAWDNIQEAIKRLQTSTPAHLAGAVENLETARLILGEALKRETQQ